MQKVLVFDFGASSGRALICTYENEGFCSTEIHRFENIPITVGDTLCWDIDGIFREVSRAIEKAGDIGFDAVSVDTWGVDFALLDENGNFIQKPVHYRDQRTNGVPEKVFERISEEKLYSRTGIISANHNTLYQLMSIKESQPELLQKAAHLLMMPDLICYYLTGEIKNEFTEASTSALVDPKTRNWDWELIESLRLPRRIFGKIVEPGAVYGTLKADFSSKPIPVIAAPSHDTASAIISAPSEEEDFAFISCGTWTLCGTELKAPIITNDARLSGLTNEGGCGKTTAFMKNIMGMWLVQECRRFLLKQGEVFTYNDLEAFASTAPHFVARIDPNDSSFFTPGSMPLKISEYCKKNGQTPPKSLAQTLRIIYESLAYQFAFSLGQIEKLTGKSYPVIYMFGGGSKDALLCQLTADASNRRVIAGPAEATALGNAMCVFISLGCVKSIGEARAIIRKSAAVTEYFPKNHAEWLKAEEKFNS